MPPRIASSKYSFINYTIHIDLIKDLTHTGSLLQNTISNFAIIFSTTLKIRNRDKLCLMHDAVQDLKYRVYI